MAQSGMVEGPLRAGHQDKGYHPLKVAEYLARPGIRTVSKPRWDSFAVRRASRCG